MNDLRKAAEMALEALESAYGRGEPCGAAIAALLEALDKPEIEPQALVEMAVLAEREACAKVCDELAAQDKLSNYYAVAAKAIRERGEK